MNILNVSKFVMASIMISGVAIAADGDFGGGVPKDPLEYITEADFNKLAATYSPTEIQLFIEDMARLQTNLTTKDFASEDTSAADRTAQEEAIGYFAVKFDRLGASIGKLRRLYIHAIKSLDPANSFWQSQFSEAESRRERKRLQRELVQVARSLVVDLSLGLLEGQSLATKVKVEEKCVEWSRHYSATCLRYGTQFAHPAHDFYRFASQCDSPTCVQNISNSFSEYYRFLSNVGKMDLGVKNLLGAKAPLINTEFSDEGLLAAAQQAYLSSFIRSGGDFGSSTAQSRINLVKLAVGAIFTPSLPLDPAALEEFAASSQYFYTRKVGVSELGEDLPQVRLRKEYRYIPEPRYLLESLEKAESSDIEKTPTASKALMQNALLSVGGTLSTPLFGGWIHEGIRSSALGAENLVTKLPHNTHLDLTDHKDLDRYLNKSAKVVEYHRKDLVAKLVRQFSF